MTAGLLVLALVASLLAALVAGAPPALALHQHCGDDLAGSYSLTNGHPEPDALNPGWNGQELLQDLDIVLQTTGFARAVAGDVVDGFDAAADLIEAIREAPVASTLLAGTPVSQAYAAAVFIPAVIGEAAVRVILLVTQILDLALIVTETVVGAVKLAYELDAADEAACGGTLVGDTLTMTWVGMIQRTLATDGPPLALLMAPHDPGFESDPEDWPVLPRAEAGDFPWCPELPQAVLGELPAPAPLGDLPDTGGDCSPTVQTGFLDAPDLGVQAIVTNTITHLVAHGIDVRDAPMLLADADSALGAGRYSDAFHLYRAAYQRAMAVTDL